jgi:hypothetical protein
MKRGVKLALLVVAGLVGLAVLCGVVMSATGVLDEAAATARATIAIAETAEAAPATAVVETAAEADATATLTLPPKDRLERDLLRLLGESNRDVNGGRKFTQIDFFDDQGSIGVTWALDDHLTPGLALSLAKTDAAVILRALDASGVPFRTATLAGTFTLEGAGGAVEEALVVQATYDHDALRDIDWETFNEAAVFRAPLARGVYIHPDMGE